MGSVQWHWTVLGPSIPLLQEVVLHVLSSLVMKNNQQKVLKSLQSFVVTNITSNLISYILWSSVDSFSLESVILFPLLHLAMTTISEKLQNVWRSKEENTDDFNHMISLETQNRLKLRELLEAQHRMMYYTVTISTVPSVRNLPDHITRRKTSCLKWQYASTLYKTQATMRKSK